MKIGIMGAMIEEVELIKHEMAVSKEDNIGGRTFISGTLNGFETVLVFSRWGKVASASTATTLLNLYNIDFLLFTGVAGAIDTSLNIGDVVVGKKLYQHDMNATPLFRKFEIPLTGKSSFSPSDEIIENGQNAAKKFIKNIKNTIPSATLSKFSIFEPKVVMGTIATGDQFVSNSSTHPEMNFNEQERASAVEMEGGAVAQICEDYEKPYLVLRTISDKADHSAEIDFIDFIKNVSNHYSKEMVVQFLSDLRESISSKENQFII